MVGVDRPSDRRPPEAEVRAFLRRHHGAEPTDLEVLRGGFWSAAYGYRIAGDELVLRIGDEPGGFESDRRAMGYASEALPVPEVLAIGQAFGRWFAVSRRHRGRFLEEVGPEEADRLAPTVVGLLAALRSVPPTGAAARPWRAWLIDGISDRPDHPSAGWHARLAREPRVQPTFRAAEARIRAGLDACPDRHQLVHGDLLHFNVLVTPAADAVTAVFSWKCSTWGDAVYDLAWCTFWGRLHAGIGALDLWSRLAPQLMASEADVAVRHHVYELQIGAAHLGWYATLGDREGLDWTVRQLAEILERGPHR